MQIDNTLYTKRRIASRIGLALSMSAMAVGLAVLIWILYVLFSNGLSALDLNLFTHDTPAPGTEGGGLRNAIIGSLMIVGLTVLVSTPVGILAGIYLTEFGEAEGLHFSTLFALGFLLFVITFVVLAAAKAMINRAEKAKGS